MSVLPNEDLPSADTPHRFRLIRRRLLVLAGAGFATPIGAIRLAGGGARCPPEPPPVESAGAWVISVGGMVGKRLGWSVNDRHWEGVRVAEALRQAAPRARGRVVTFRAYGGSYSDSPTLTEASAAAETLLADALDGRPLPPMHGGPRHLVVPSQLGYKNVKWVVRLAVAARRGIA